MSSTERSRSTTTDPLLLLYLQVQTDCASEHEALNKLQQAALEVAFHRAKPPERRRLATPDDLLPGTVLWVHRDETDPMREDQEWYWMFVGEHLGSDMFRDKDGDKHFLDARTFIEAEG